MSYFNYHYCYTYGYVGQPFTNDFPHADIHELLALDLLHQIIKGAFKDHFVEWVERYIHAVYGTDADAVLDDIDRRYIELFWCFSPLCSQRYLQNRCSSTLFWS